MTFSADGLDRLLQRLDETEPGGRRVADEVVRLTLQGAKRRGWPFDHAWRSARERLQPPNRGGVSVNDRLTRDLLEERALLDELEPAFRAAYEDRPLTRRDHEDLAFLAAPRLDGEAPVPTRLRRTALPDPVAFAPPLKATTEVSDVAVSAAN